MADRHSPRRVRIDTHVGPLFIAVPKNGPVVVDRETMREAYLRRERQIAFLDGVFAAPTVNPDQRTTHTREIRISDPASRSATP